MNLTCTYTIMIELTLKTGEKMKFRFKQEIHFLFLFYTLKGEYDFQNVDKKIRLKTESNQKEYYISEFEKCEIIDENTN